jgi:hypothetical protein
MANYEDPGLSKSLWDYQTSLREIAYKALNLAACVKKVIDEEKREAEELLDEWERLRVIGKIASIMNGEVTSEYSGKYECPEPLTEYVVAFANELIKLIAPSNQLINNLLPLTFLPKPLVGGYFKEYLNLSENALEHVKNQLGLIEGRLLSSLSSDIDYFIMPAGIKADFKSRKLKLILSSDGGPNSLTKIIAFNIIAWNYLKHSLLLKVHNVEIRLEGEGESKVVEDVWRLMCNHNARISSEERPLFRMITSPWREEAKVECRLEIRGKTALIECDNVKVLRAFYDYKEGKVRLQGENSEAAMSRRDFIQAVHNCVAKACCLPAMPESDEGYALLIVSAEPLINAVLKYI